MKEKKRNKKRRWEQDIEKRDAKEMKSMSEKSLEKVKIRKNGSYTPK